MNKFTHVIIDFYECKLERVHNHDSIKERIYSFANLNGLKVLKSCEFIFEPQGFTSILLLSESHISIHTWPESGKVAFDCFSCIGIEKLDEGVRLLCDYLQPEKFEMRNVERFK